MMIFGTVCQNEHLSKIGTMVSCSATGIVFRLTILDTMRAVSIHFLLSDIVNRLITYPSVP